MHGPRCRANIKRRPCKRIDQRFASFAAAGVVPMLPPVPRCDMMIRGTDAGGRFIDAPAPWGVRCRSMRAGQRTLSRMVHAVQFQKFVGQQARVVVAGLGGIAVHRGSGCLGRGHARTRLRCGQPGHAHGPGRLMHGRCRDRAGNAAGVAGTKLFAAQLRQFPGLRRRRHAGRHLLFAGDAGHPRQPGRGRRGDGGQCDGRRRYRARCAVCHRAGTPGAHPCACRPARRAGVGSQWLPARLAVHRRDHVAQFAGRAGHRRGVGRAGY